MLEINIISCSSLSIHSLNCLTLKTTNYDHKIINFSQTDSIEQPHINYLGLQSPAYLKIRL